MNNNAIIIYDNYILSYAKTLMTNEMRRTTSGDICQPDKHWSFGIWPTYDIPNYLVIILSSTRVRCPGLREKQA